MFREEENARAARAAQMFTSGAKVDEIREMNNLDPLGDDRGEMVLVAQNLVPLKHMSNITRGPGADQLGTANVESATQSEAAAIARAPEGDASQGPSETPPG